MIIRQETVQNKVGETLQLTLEQLTEKDLEAIMNLQQEVLEALVDKMLYLPFSEEEIREHFLGRGEIIGYCNEEKELVALAIYVQKGDHSSNYGYDLGMTAEEVVQVGHVDTVLVVPDYRGYGLQGKLMQELERIAIDGNTPVLCATASPANPFSVDNFLKLGYEIGTRKLKYGGMDRYVLIKRL